MPEHLIEIEEARENLLACAAYLAENIKSADGYAEAMKEIVPRYLDKAAVDRAAQLADSIADPFVRDRLLSAVAEKCAEIDDDDYAFQLIESIEDFGSQAEARERVAVKKAAAGDFEKAFETAAALEHPSHALSMLAYYLIASNREDEAAQTLERIEFPAAKAEAMQHIAAFYGEHDRAAEAEKYLDAAAATAGEIDFAEEKIRTLEHLADDYLSGGRADRAIEIFDCAKAEAEKLDGIHRDAFLARIATGLLRAGSVELADETLDRVTDKTQIAAALLGFAREFTGRGKVIEALEALEESYAILKSQREREIRDSRARFGLLASVATQFAGAGKAERSIEIAQGIADESEKTSALAQIARICTTLEKDDAARQAIADIGDDAQKMFALISVSDEKKKQGNLEQALETLNEAAHLAETVPQLSARSAAYNQLAKRFAGYGAADRARRVSHENLEVIAQIRDETTRSIALAQLNDVYEQANFHLTEPEKTIIGTLLKRSEW